LGQDVRRHNGARGTGGGESITGVDITEVDS